MKKKFDCSGTTGTSQEKTGKTQTIAFKKAIPEDIQMRTNVPHIFAIGSGLSRPHRRLWPCAQGIKVKKGLFPWTASGRAIANGRDEGVTKLLFDDSP